MSAPLELLTPLTRASLPAQLGQALSGGTQGVAREVLALRDKWGGTTALPNAAEAALNQLSATADDASVEFVKHSAEAMSFAISHLAAAVPKNNLSAVTDPGTTGDPYVTGSIWINVALNKVWVCTGVAGGVGTWQLAAPSAGSGDVTGPGSSTDNAAVRWDGVTGKFIQDGRVIIEDDGTLRMKDADKIRFRGQSGLDGAYISANPVGPLGDDLLISTGAHGDSEIFVTFAYATYFRSLAAGVNDVLTLLAGGSGGATNKYFQLAAGDSEANLTITGPGGTGSGLLIDVTGTGEVRVTHNAGANKYRLIAEGGNMRLLTAKGDLFATDGTTTQRLGVGPDGQVLTADSAQALGMKWAATASSGHTIRENGADQTARGALNFVDADAGAGFLTDDAGNNETEVNLNLYGLLAGRASIQTWTAAQRISSNNKWEFRDSGIFAHSDADGSLIVESDVTAWFKGLTTTKIGVNGNVQLGSGATEIDVLAGADRKANLGNASVRFEQGHIAEFLHLYGVSGSSLAALRIDQQTAPSSPVDGDVWHDGTQNALFSFQSGMKTGSAGVILAAEGATCANTTTETSVLGTVTIGSATMAANFGVRGKILHFHASGLMSTKASSPGTLQLRFKKGTGGGTSVMAHTPSFTVTSGMSSGEWSLDIYLQFITSSSLEGRGWFLFFAGGQIGGQPFRKSDSMLSASEALDFTAQWSLADAANSFSCQQVLVETLG